MADNALGKASLILATDANPLNQGLDASQTKVTQWTEQIKKTTTQAFDGIGFALRSALVCPFAGVLQGLEKLWNYTFKSLDLSHWYAKIQGVFGEVQGEAKAAIGAGIGTSAFQSIMAGSKVDADTLSFFFTRLQKSIGDAKLGGEEARRAFAGLGLTVDDFTGKKPDQQFLLIAEKLHSIADANVQAKVAFDIFGKQAAQILPSIRRGLTDAIEEAKRMGLVLSDADNEAIASIGRNWGMVGKAIKGIWRQIAAAAAPVFVVISDLAKEWFVFLNPLIQQAAKVLKVFTVTFQGIFEVIKSYLGPVGDYIKELFAPLQAKAFDPATLLEPILQFEKMAVNAVLDVAEWFVKGGAMILANFVSPTIKAFGDILEALALLLPGVVGIVEGFQDAKSSIVNNFVVPLLRGLQALMSAMALVNPLAAPGLLVGLKVVNDKIASLKASADAPIKFDVSGATEGLKNAADGVRGFADKVKDTATGLKDFAIPRAPIDGFFDAVEARIKGMGKKVGEALKGGIDPVLLSAADDVNKKFGKDAYTKMQEEMTKLGELFANGLISPEVYGKAMEEQLSKAEKELNVKPIQQASAMLAGSKEAANVVYQASFGGQSTNDPTARLERLTEAQNQLQQRVAIATEQMVKLWGDRQEMGFV